MKNVRIKLAKNCISKCWRYGIFEGKKCLMWNRGHRSGGCIEEYWWKKPAAIRNAKAMAKRIGIKYDPEIIKEHGC